MTAGIRITRMLPFLCPDCDGDRFESDEYGDWVCVRCNIVVDAGYGPLVPMPQVAS